MMTEDFTSTIWQNVPRETFLIYEKYVALISKWQKSINLISHKKEDIWSRHIEDSLQLVKYLSIQSDVDVVDLGSGAGLPGIVLAIARPDIRVILIESDKRKAIFLKEVIRELGLTNCVAENIRVEQWQGRADVVTSRALANLEQLLEYAAPILKPNAFCLFLKGANWSMEVAQAQKNWNFAIETFDSQTASESKVIKLNQITKKTH